MHSFHFRHGFSPVNLQRLFLAGNQRLFAPCHSTRGLSTQMHGNALKEFPAAEQISASDTRSRTMRFDYVPTLDGWRGLAVLGVVFFHCLNSGLVPGSIWAKLAARGHIGV